MKNILLLLVLVLGLQTANAQYVTIPDVNFRFFIENFYPGCINASKQLDTTCSDILSETMVDIRNRNISSIEGIQYFKSLQIFNCQSNLLTSLVPLPATVQNLVCSDNHLTALPSLPNSLIELKCDGNAIATLPSLPSTLQQLSCAHNLITVLPTLPTSLQSLFCFDNILTSLPALPSGLQDLNCNNNQLTILPALPAALQNLDCSYNQLSVLPSLPNGLVELTCRYNQLTALPALHSALEFLTCNNNQISVLPQLPDGLQELQGDFNRLTSISSLPNALYLLSTVGNPLECLPVLPSGLDYLHVKRTHIKCLPNAISASADVDTLLSICTDPSDICNFITIVAGSKKLNFKLFPNPTSSSIRIELPYNGTGNWYLTDISGNRIKQNGIENNTDAFDINVADVANGTYLLSLEINGNVSTSKVTIVR
ncbi:MAG: T9SS type A sorting domain-containing protein [Chitinophagales bacterium]